MDAWGRGAPVVLVHGSLATGGEEWAAQLPLADEGFRLLVPDRRGYGRSPAATGEDFLADAEDIAEVIEHQQIGLAAGEADPAAAGIIALEANPAGDKAGGKKPSSREAISTRPPERADFPGSTPERGAIRSR